MRIHNLTVVIFWVFEHEVSLRLHVTCNNVADELREPQLFKIFPAKYVMILCPDVFSVCDHFRQILVDSQEMTNVV